MADSEAHRSTAPTVVPRGRHAPPLEVRLTVQRRRLFEAAATVFARLGFAEATAEAIAREAGMSKATFYEHFANKEEAILALFDEAAAGALGRLADAAAEGRAPAGRGRGGSRRARSAWARGAARLRRQRRRVPRRLADAVRGDHRRRPTGDGATRRDHRRVRDGHRRREQARPRALRHAAVQVAPRHGRPRRRHLRARLTPAAPQATSRRPRARAGHRATDPWRPRLVALSAAQAARRGWPSSRPRSSSAGAVRAWWPGARRWPASSAPRSPTRTTGAARSPASATRRP